MEQELEKISGTVEDVTYHNEESGFTVLLVDVDGDPVTVVGEVPEIAEGEEITATGSYKVHGTYGVQFRAELIERTLPATAGSIRKYLSSGAVKGLGPALARSVVEYRAANGEFRSRRDLLKVPRLGAKAFEQCAGFLRIPGASDPLDASAVHPESYPVVGRMASDLGVRVADLLSSAELRAKIDLQRYVTERTGLPTLRDILSELARPGLDPRGEARIFEFADVHSIDGLREGMVLPGIVTNVAAFGAFVDIGIKQDGLVHVSELSDRYVASPSDAVRLRQQVRVRVVSVDRRRGRIGLSMRGLDG